MAMSELKQKLFQNELAKAGFRDTVYEPQNDVIRINTGDERRMFIYDNNDITYFPPDRDSALYMVRPLVDMVKEIVETWENSQPLPFDNLSHYHKLAEYNNIVLAARDDTESGHGLHFVTWRYTYDRTGVDGGNHTENYAAAKEDFAKRAGLVPEEKLFTQEQAAEIKSAIEYRLENDRDFYLTYEKEGFFKSIAAQISGAYPDINTNIIYNIESWEDIKKAVKGTESIDTAKTICGEVQSGDWVIATANNDYRYLLGTVTAIDKFGLSEHSTDNITDDIHVDFTAFDYPPERIAEIEKHFSELYGEPKIFDELPLNDVIMSPKELLSIKDLEHSEIIDIGNFRNNCEDFCSNYMGSNLTEVYLTDEHTELITRVEKNYADYKESLSGLDKSEINKIADRVSAVSDAYLYLTTIYDIPKQEMDFYLQCQNPLEVVAEACHDLFNKQDALVDYPFIGDIETSKNSEIAEQEPTSERGMTEYEFKKNMADIIPNIDSEAMQNLINYANELAESGTTTKSEFFRDTFLEYILVTRHFEPEITKQLLDVCKTFALNHFELRGAAENLRDGAEVEKIAQMAIDGKCDNGLSKADKEYKSLLQEFKNRTFGYPHKNETLPETPNLPEKSDKTAVKPKTLEGKLNAAKEKVKEQGDNNNKNKSHKREERE